MKVCAKLMGLLQVYKQFKEGQKRILVATDLVGRGIDIERVNIVINYDMPETDERHGNGADSYLHRVWHPDACHAQPSTQPTSSHGNKLASYNYFPPLCA